MVRPMLSDCCPVCLSVTLVYCDQMVGWIKMKVGVEVGLGPGHVVLDGDPAPASPKGHSPPSPILGPCLLWPNGWMDHDATWYKGIGLGPCHTVLHGDLSPPKEKGAQPPANFRPMSTVVKRSPIYTAEHIVRPYVRSNNKIRVQYVKIR